VRTGGAEEVEFGAKIVVPIDRAWGQTFELSAEVCECELGISPGDVGMVIDRDCAADYKVDGGAQADVAADILQVAIADKK
jgi:hypothetical protein